MKLEYKKHLADKNMLQIEYGDYTNIKFKIIRIGIWKNYQKVNSS